MLRSTHHLGLMLLVCLAGATGFSACTTSKSTQNEPINRPIQLPAIAPGTVRVDARLGDCAEQARWYECELVVDQVQEYGSSTPQLPSGTKLDVRILNAHMDDMTTESPSLLMKDNLIRFLLAYERQSNPEAGVPMWKVVSATAVEK